MFEPRCLVVKSHKQSTKKTVITERSQHSEKNQEKKMMENIVCGLLVEGEVGCQYS